MEGGLTSGDISASPSGSASFNHLRMRKKIYRMMAAERSLRSMSSRTLSNRGGFSSVRDSIPSVVSENQPLVAQTDKIAEEGGIAPKEEEAGEGEGEEEMFEKVPLKEFLIEIVLGKIVSVFLIAAPFAIFCDYLGWSDTWKFWLNFMVMIPLAAILGDFTEELALHTNQTIGGLINATFGNAVEVVVSIQALCANEIRVVQGSMIGSIFSNLLLVLGCCFLFGGFKHKEQPFNATSAIANIGLLALSGIAMVLPTPFAEYYDLEDEKVLQISRISSIVLMFVYLQMLYFQLSTHAHLFEDDVGDVADVELASTSFGVAALGLVITTLLVTYFSENLVDSIGGFVETSGISRTFVGLILLPIVGNAVEHVTAVTVAMKNKMDLAMGVAVGSCTQISLFVLPLTILIGWAIDKNMTLNFPPFEIMLYVLSVIFVAILFAHPKGNWLEGSLLITTYVLIAIGVWYEQVEDY